MKIIKQVFKGALGGATIGFLFCFLSFYLLTPTFRDDFYISAANYSILGFCIGSIYGLINFFVQNRRNRLKKNQLLFDSAIGLISSVIGCLPFVMLFLYEITQKKSMSKLDNSMQEYIAKRIYDFSLYVIGVLIFSTIIACLLGLIKNNWGQAESAD